MEGLSHACLSNLNLEHRTSNPEPRTSMGKRLSRYHFPPISPSSSSISFMSRSIAARFASSWLPKPLSRLAVIARVACPQRSLTKGIFSNGTTSSVSAIQTRAAARLAGFDDLPASASTSRFTARRRARICFSFEATLATKSSKASRGTESGAARPRPFFFGTYPRMKSKASPDAVQRPP
jgi:hypothetical protein